MIEALWLHNDDELMGDYQASSPTGITVAPKKLKNCPYLANRNTKQQHVKMTVTYNTNTVILANRG